MSDKDNKINDLTIQYLVLLQLIVEKIEEFEQEKFLVGQIKMFLKNAKSKFERYIEQVFKGAADDGHDVTPMASRLLVMKERVEVALLNEYVITVDQRRERAREVLSKYLSKDAVVIALKEMEEKNLFNF